MAGVEIVGLLCAGSTRYHESGSVSLSVDKLTRIELAGLLSGLSDQAVNLALAKYALDEDSERLLIAHLRVYAAGVAVREHWQTVRGRPTIVNMAAMAAFEVVRPNRCTKCYGRGVVVMRSCCCCHGTGFKAVSGRKVAEALCVDECNYRRLWRARYEIIVSYVQGLDADVARVLHYADKINRCAVV